MARRLIHPRLVMLVAGLTVIISLTVIAADILAPRHRLPAGAVQGAPK